jgi:hypothetical protein
MKTWAEKAGSIPPSRSIDRDAGEGPPRCCARRLVAADALMYYGLLARVVGRFAHLQRVPLDELYLCDACGETLVRERVVTREERALAFGLPAAAVAKARAHDLVFGEL